LNGLIKMMKSTIVTVKGPANSIMNLDEYYDIRRCLTAAFS
jgi:hypothetical protein